MKRYHSEEEYLDDMDLAHEQDRCFENCKRCAELRRLAAIAQRRLRVAGRIIQSVAQGDVARHFDYQCLEEAASNLTVAQLKLEEVGR